jgi:beta-1,4-mannosyltransferase
LASPYLENKKDNPVLFLLYQAMEKQGAEIKQFNLRRLVSESWDIWHVHWPELLIGLNEPSPVRVPVNLIKFWIKLKIARAKKIKIFWTVHNVRPHERHRQYFERAMWRIFLPNIDGIICMTKSAQEHLHKEHPATKIRPIFIIPHGHYRGVYPDTISKDEAREELKIGRAETVITFIGQIRAYKGVLNLIRCFNAAAVQNCRLVIAGKPHENAAEITELSSCNKNIQLHLRFIDEAEMQFFLRAADLVVLPYKDILNSGSALLALSFDKPIIVPNRGAMADLYELMGPDWVHLYTGDLTPKILEDSISWVRNARSSCDKAPLKPFGWDRIATLTMAAFSTRF